MLLIGRSAKSIAAWLVAGNLGQEPSDVVEASPTKSATMHA
jgi:hypothetical protein